MKKTFGIILSSLLFAAPALGGGILTGKKIFEVRCATCHGMSAKGSVSTAKALKVDPRALDLTQESIVRKSAKELEKLISGGHGLMPKQKERLTREEIRRVVRYLQSLQSAYVLKKTKP